MKLCDLLKFNDIVIQCHNFPDADTIATGYAVYWYLRMKGKSPRLIYSGSKEISKSNLVLMVRNLGIPLEYVTECDHIPELLLTVDCTYGESNVQKFDARNIAVIDHHISHIPQSELVEIRSDYCSCSSVVTEMLADEGIDINSDKKIATALYYGLYTDSGALSEIGHPADKNLRDFADYNKSLITLLANTIISPNEMMIAGEALRNCNYMKKEKMAVACASSCDPNILGIISDFILQVDTVECCVVYCKISGGFKLSVRSCVNTVNAPDLAKFLTSGVGSGGGHTGKAGGFIPEDAFKEEQFDEYIISRMKAYHYDTDILHANINHVDLSGMKRYEKKDVVFGFLPSTDIAPAGTEIFIRMFEGDINLQVADDIYIMVGVSGEVYPIKKDVFNKRYIRCDELPDMSGTYMPTIGIKELRESRKLINYIKGCRASGTSAIMAVELKRYTKVFTKWINDTYMYGVPGDYLAVTEGSDTDIYIIKRDVFKKLYTS